MKEYIELEVAHDAIKKLQEKLETNDDKAWAVNKPYYKGLAMARGILNETPAADVELVRHGKWIEHHGQSYLVLPMKYDEDGEPILQPYISYECSICGRRESVKEPYCHCGAKMDEE